MKRSHAENRDTDVPQTHPLCWSKDAQAQAFRVEMDDGSFVVLPYDHLGFVKLEPQKDSDLLHVFLSTHDIQITGRNLRALGLAFQKCAVDWIRALPARSSPQAEDDYVWIKNITLRDIER